MSIKAATVARKSVFGFILIVTVIISFFPVVWMFLTSLKTSMEIYAFPVVYIPTKLTFQNYVDVFTQNRLARFFFNSVLVGSVATVVCLAVSSLAAYGLSRFRVRHNLLILVIILGFSTFPFIASVIPLFDVLRRLRLLNTYFSLMLPYIAFNIPFSVWLSFAYFKEFPLSIEDAAKIDGCSRLGTLWRIFYPLSAPVLSSVAIVTFINCWNEFIFALILISKPHMRTIPAGIALYPGEYSFPWETISAAAVVATLPIIFFIVFFQKKIISGLTRGAVKG
jgi:multiple sugar transport system permease protein